ncbi:S49 family peptidase [Patescibacteria group bacterium]|nr:S49 family peptidase [Patescibacteria group bacterium]
MKFKFFNKKIIIKFFKYLGMLLVATSCLIIIKDEIFWILNGEEIYYEDFSFFDENCNVAKIDLKGFMDVENYDGDSVSSSEIVSAIENANNSENIKAIILDVDSGGGYPITGEEICNALIRTDIPTVTLIRGLGASAAYWAATGADVIFASSLSDIGSIGVTISYLDNVAQNQIEGLHFNQLSTGEYKDTLNTNKTLTYNEKLLIERDLNITLDNFIKVVSENRNINIDQVRKMSDGSTMQGKMALENNLIDYIGDLYDVKTYLVEVIDEEVIICN